MNFCIDPDRVLVGVDNSCAVLDGDGVTHPNGTATKVVFLPSCKAVLTGRGHQGVFAFVALRALLATRLSFDEMLENIQGYIVAANQAMLASATAQNVVFDDRGQEILFAGWSPSLGRMTASIFETKPPVGALTVTHGIGATEPEQWVCLWPAHAGAAPELSSEASMVDLLRVQVADVERRFPAQGMAGGNFTLVEVTHSGASFRNVEWIV